MIIKSQNDSQHPLETVDVVINLAFIELPSIVAIQLSIYRKEWYS